MTRPDSELAVALVVLDMAGTTIEDSGQVPAAFSGALAQHGIKLQEDALRAVRGASKREAIRHLLATQRELAPADLESASEAAYQDFKQLLVEIFRRDGVRPVAGAPEALRWLRSRRVKVALNTGFDREIATLIVEAVGWGAAHFDALVCGDEVAQGRPAPDLILRSMAVTGVAHVNQVAVVGDTVLDLQAGHNAGVRWNIGVLSGAHAEKQLASAPHTHLLPSVAALQALDWHKP
jgi:phosphonatase-like hydrolase